MSRADDLYNELAVLSKRRGYYLGPDLEFTKDLVSSLVKNEERYGHPSCPCRLASVERKQDLDIICPCDYRDQDVVEFGACYCGLYVSRNVSQGLQKLEPIPERRPNKETRLKMAEEKSKLEIQNPKLGSALPVWRCSVCGYLCAREDAPDICPICGVSHDRFERFI